jgi:hypothetical protein
MIDSLRSTLGQSRTIKYTYESAREKLSETYRKVKSGSGGQQYRELADPTAAAPDYALNDSGMPGDELEIVPHPAAENPVLTSDDVADCWARFVADPFLIYGDGLYHLFFEIQSVGRNVCIGHAFSEDGIQYEYNQIVMQPETAQHTYPHVFKHDGTWLMIPSPGTNVSGEFRVYQAVEFPTEWELVATPITEGVRLDPTPIRSGETWYVIHQRENDYAVELKYADSLTGTWHTHPSSPLFEPDVDEIESGNFGKAEMVPSGRPFYIDGDIHLFYRSHLDRCVYHYRVTELDRDRFSQEECTPSPVFDGKNTHGWNRGFMHTVNPVYPWDGTENIVAVDGMEIQRYMWSIGIYTLDTSNSKKT